MKAIGITTSLSIEHVDSLVDIQHQKPKAAGRDLLVKIKAVSLNPVDYKVRVGSAKNVILGSPKILGYDAAGIVEAVGDEVQLFKVGDEVYYAGDITRAGSNAEYQLVDERIVGHKPLSLSFAEASAIPLTALTAWELIFDRLMLTPSSISKDVVLIIGGAGGVGSMAIQILKKIVNARVIATASRAESTAWCKSLGADIVVHHGALIDNLRKEDVEGVDCIFNFVNTDHYWEQMCALIKPQGKIGCIVPPAKELNLGLLFNKSVRFAWELMFTRSSFQTEDMIRQHEILNEISKLYDKKIFTSIVTTTVRGLTTENLKQGHLLMESGKSIGKFVIEF